MLVTLQSCSVDCDDFELQITGRFAWARSGSANVTSPTAMDLLPGGMAAIHVAFSKAGVADGQSTLRFPLGSGPVALCATEASSCDATAVVAFVQAAEKAHTDKLNDRFGSLAEIATAVEAAVMWNLVVTPAENGMAPFMPVSRKWDFSPRPMNSDFTYVIFDWDNIFASLLAGLVDRDLAYSNFIQVIKSKTSAGFVPNFAAGGSKSQDRTEPPVGAQVLVELHKRFGDLWIVELLIDDLVDWSDWFMRSRVLQPVGLVALGTRNEQNGAIGSLQDARYESGLDNSPMYDTPSDADLFDNTTGLMQLYDVGMASLLARETEAIAQLAELLGESRASLAQEMRARAKDLQGLIAKHHWDGRARVFANVFSKNGSFSDRISPTSFYALLAGAATDEQAKLLATEWLMSPTRFCVAPNGDFQGNSDDCYWGLPSIQAADPAFPPLGYWRGYVWGPMGLLTYWSLQRYGHVPEVAMGRKALATQLSELMLAQWRMNRHICENFGPHKNTTDCTGSKFYHWGALAGLIKLIEDGHYDQTILTIVA